MKKQIFFFMSSFLIAMMAIVSMILCYYLLTKTRLIIVALHALLVFKLWREVYWRLSSSYYAVIHEDKNCAAKIPRDEAEIRFQSAVCDARYAEKSKRKNMEVGIKNDTRKTTTCHLQIFRWGSILPWRNWFQTRYSILDTFATRGASSWNAKCNHYEDGDKLRTPSRIQTSRRSWPHALLILSR